MFRREKLQCLGIKISRLRLQGMGAMKGILSVLITMIISQNAIAGSYTVTFREFGFNRDNCADDVAAVAQTFAGDAKVSILSSGCLPPENGDIFPSGKFTYAAKGLVVTTTSDAREAWGLDGYYKSIAECKSALQFERDIFTRLTGLRPYIGYCYQANVVSAPRYRVRMDAVGNSAIKKHSMSTSWMHKSVNEEGLVSSVKSMVKSVGGEVVAAMAGRNISGHLVAIDYYHEKAFHLHSQELLYWRSVESCQASANSLNHQWNFESHKGIFHCTVTVGGASRLLQVYLSDNLLSGFDFETEIYATVYLSQSACLSDVPRIRSTLEQSGTSVLGMTCGQENALQSWRLAVFSQTN